MWPFNKKEVEVMEAPPSNKCKLREHPIWSSLGIPYMMDGELLKPVYTLDGKSINIGKILDENGNEKIQLNIVFDGSSVMVLIERGGSSGFFCSWVNVVSPVIPYSQSEKFYGFILEILDKAMESDEEDMDTLIKHWRGDGI